MFNRPSSGSLSAAGLAVAAAVLELASFGCDSFRPTNEGQPSPGVAGVNDIPRQEPDYFVKTGPVGYGPNPEDIQYATNASFVASFSPRVQENYNVWANTGRPTVQVEVDGESKIRHVYCPADGFGGSGIEETFDQQNWIGQKLSPELLRDISRVARKAINTAFDKEPRV